MLARRRLLATVAGRSPSFAASASGRGGASVMEGLLRRNTIQLQSAKALAGDGAAGSGGLSPSRRQPQQQRAAAAAAAAGPDSAGMAAAPNPHDAAVDTAKRNATTVLAGPYRRVGNVFIVTCEDHPFKHGWEVNRMLRDLRLEFKGQTTIHPDIPEVRKRLWRVRHIVRVDLLDLDAAKELVGIPAHVSFSDLASQIPRSFGRGGATANPGIRSKVRFMRLRRMRLRDILHRDQLEKSILEEKRKLLAATGPPAGEGTAEVSDGKEGGAAATGQLSGRPV